MRFHGVPVMVRQQGHTVAPEPHNAAQMLHCSASAVRTNEGSLREQVCALCTEAHIPTPTTGQKVCQHTLASLAGRAGGPVRLWLVHRVHSKKDFSTSFRGRLTRAPFPFNRASKGPLPCPCASFTFPTVLPETLVDNPWPLRYIIKSALTPTLPSSPPPRVSVH